MRKEKNMNEKIEEIIKTEWQMFQKVNNIGGRACCQDDYETFYIMRRSQYENWAEKMIDVYLDFILHADYIGRNLVEEKYARMMAYTDIHYYNKHLRDRLAPVPLRNYRIINEILKILLPWEDQIARAYPKLAGCGRPVHSEDDQYGFTSMETYARGEMETYPQQLLLLYLDYIKELQAQGLSFSEKVMTSMVARYGYESIQEAEESI